MPEVVEKGGLFPGLQTWFYLSKGREGESFNIFFNQKLFPITIHPISCQDPKELLLELPMLPPPLRVRGRLTDLPLQGRPKFSFQSPRKSKCPLDLENNDLLLHRSHLLKTSSNVRIEIPVQGWNLWCSPHTTQTVLPSHLSLWPDLIL